MRSRLPPLNSLRLFEAAARHENFTSAAAELGMTQAAVSYQVKLLEERLGLKLFRREGRGVVLTEPGRRAAREVCAPSGMAGEHRNNCPSILRHDDERRVGLLVRKQPRCRTNRDRKSADKYKSACLSPPARKRFFHAAGKRHSFSSESACKG